MFSTLSSQADVDPEALRGLGSPGEAEHSQIVIGTRPEPNMCILYYMHVSLLSNMYVVCCAQAPFLHCSLCLCARCGGYTPCTYACPYASCLHACSAVHAHGRAVRQVGREGELRRRVGRDACNAHSNMVITGRFSFWNRTWFAITSLAMRNLSTKRCRSPVERGA